MMLIFEQSCTICTTIEHGTRTYLLCILCAQRGGLQTLNYQVNRMMFFECCSKRGFSLFSSASKRTPLNQILKGLIRCSFKQVSNKYNLPLYFYFHIRKTIKLSTQFSSREIYPCI